MVALKEPAALRDEAAPIDWWGLLSDPVFLADPYAELARLRALAPVHHDRSSGVYFILGHREFARVSKSSDMGRDTRRWAGGWASPEYAANDPVGFRLFSAFQPQMINSDPPDHGRMRGVYEPGFHPKAIAALEPMILSEARHLIEAMPDAGVVEMIDAFAGPLPLRVLCNLFDMPEGMDADIARWSAALIKIGDVLMTPEQKFEAMEALEAFKSFLRSHLAARRGCPHAGRMIGLVLNAEREGVLDQEETLTNLVSMLIAGHETTVTLIGNGLLLLLRNPVEMARLRADRGLMRTAIEEFLRVEPGGNMILRIAREDVEVGGVSIPAGAPVIGLIGAVNRDPARFKAPDDLNIGRTANAHATFGGGIHFCVGAPLARLEAQIAFDALLDRFPVIEQAGLAEWRLDRINARGLARLPVRVETAG